MYDFYSKVQHVLELEKQKQFTNSAVSGGLQNFTSFLSKQKIIDNIPDKDFEEINDFFKSYQFLSYNERRDAVLSLLSVLEEGTNHSALATSHPSNQTTNRQKRDKSVFQDPALYAGIQSIKGIGPRNVKYFVKLGIHSIYDLLRHYPRKYQDFSQLKTINQIVYGEEVTLTGIILGDIVNRKAKNRKLTISEAILSDSTGTIQLTWFNQPFLKNQLKAGMGIVVSGKVDQFRGRLTMASPAWEELEKEHIHTNRIVPIYPSTAGISQKQIRKIIKKNVDFWSSRIREYLPAKILEENGFKDIGYSVSEIHFPENSNVLHKIQKRFAFEEIFFLQLGTLYLKSRIQKQKSCSFRYGNKKLLSRQEALPYKLTSAQEKAIDVILTDLSSHIAMNRLLQGDVGSGKTVVAKFAIDAIVDNGAQAVVLTPTSILAEQHYQTFRELLITSGSLKKNEIGLLLGKTTAKERERLKEELTNGYIKCIVGTHALLEEDIIFQDLQLVIIDEQHRFGVNQRNIMRRKGNDPHVLVMSATPIPRSLAITVFGDLDITIIDEMPPGRIPVKTMIIQKSQREDAYAKVREQINNGFQAFIVYPLIGDDGENEEKSAISNQQRLQNEVFPKFKVGLLHGKMKTQEKDEIMQLFRDGEYDVLVSTTVIEVGVDIPGATIVIIESANYFGLAQLHQLRGRVGRNQQESFCILIPDNDDAAENERLIAMVETTDGFKLADIDLRLRGPGEFLGTRQSGYIGFKFASLANTKLIEICHQYVRNIIKEDQQLTDPDHLLLKEELTNRWPGIIEKSER